ncbi:hypothetical protein [Mycolicibacterium psychrotolerans]|uniref:Uncharacterized protein n=1 Tax=Mycolicibacterium psychrotolerans TaxID=216929 RepID=A0A7I7MD81_9MYCO|nr:hypothetical protein [Mycolicibacterium psychrotolerans]BBX70244.1 hypothetical protein MPSYJ_37050 [Mycolicibacterium psychrotolerans]
MGAVLGLSLTATEVVWALVDEAARTVADHDAVEWDTSPATAAAAARGAHALARACGLEVERVRLVWTPDAEVHGLRLRAHLGSLGVDAEAVPLTCATRVLVDPGQCDMPPLVALAYGAALADVEPAEALTVPLPRQTPARRPRRPARVVAAALGVAAAAAVGAVFLTAGSVPHVEPAASAIAPPAGADPGWVSVTAPADGAAEPLRKVVTEPSEPSTSTGYVQYAAPLTAAPVSAAVPEAVPVPAAVPVPEAVPVSEAVPAPAAVPVPEAVPAPEAVPVPEAAAEAHLPATDQQHLPGAEPVVAPLPGPDAEAPLLPDTDMTVPVNLFTALP